jgi:hypothetical protein
MRRPFGFVGIGGRSVGILYHMRLTRIACALLLMMSSRALGWGAKEHLQLTRIAVERLVADAATPPAMRQWLIVAAPGLMDRAGEKAWFMESRQGVVPRGVDGIAYWSVMPDIDAAMEARERREIKPFAVPERLLHFIDLESFAADDAHRTYRNDLSGRPKLSDIPRDMRDPRWAEAGMLPFRVQDCYKKLVRDLRAGKLNDKPGQYPRDEHAAHWAGFLAHYLEDNTQPQHATSDYRSASYFADRRNSPNVHAQLEYMMADDEHDDHAALRREYWPLLEKAIDSMKDPLRRSELWTETCEVSLRSYEALPLIGQAAMAAAGQGGTPDAPRGEINGSFDTDAFFRFRGRYLGREMSVMEMKAYQQAWAEKRVENTLRRAWDEAMDR